MEAPPPMPRDDDDDRGDYSESNYDTFEGYGGSLVDPTAAYEQDDKEADDVWAAIDAKMDSKRKARREKKQKEEMEKYRASRPKIQDQFADAKKDLASVSDTEWYNIPEIGDQTKRFRKKVKTNLGFLPVPDSVLEKSKSEGEYLSSLDAKQAELGIATPMSDGLKTPYGGTATPDQKSLGEARTRMLDVMMKRMSDSVTGQTVVDPKGYLTGLSSVKVSTDAEIGDLKKAEKLLESVRKTNPKHGPAWIASARLAEVAGKIANARKLITQGCQTCPDSEDVWIEAARLHNPEDAKGILAKAVKQLSTSVKIWLQAAKLETDPKNQKKVLRKALETVPTSVMLWKAAIELENPDDAKLMLARAVECVPHSVEMWLALAHLETYENARKVLNKARTTIPTDPTIWITAAQLEESHGNLKVVGTIIKRAVASLAAHVALSRDQWLAEAEKSEQVGSVATCQALIQETIGIGIEDEDKKTSLDVGRGIRTGQRHGQHGTRNLRCRTQDFSRQKISVAGRGRPGKVAWNSRKSRGKFKVGLRELSQGRNFVAPCGKGKMESRRRRGCAGNSERGFRRKWKFRGNLAGSCQVGAAKFRTAESARTFGKSAGKNRIGKSLDEIRTVGTGVRISGSGKVAPGHGLGNVPTVPKVLDDAGTARGTTASS
eukprot:TRINITY_DN5376_c0_g1_i1.p1 TRINITY_DN5376_c0_g1~~TRINITY_DN5376_c0_g1_i1.p1  ORF type:complete len:721 (+),score=219.96 TRINITY_DN5376_c0_g1_i1:181-2163(+)